MRNKFIVVDSSVVYYGDRLIAYPLVIRSVKQDENACGLSKLRAYLDYKDSIKLV